MAAVYPNEGLPILLSLLLKDVAFPVLSWQMILWSNNYTPIQSTVLADLTVATFTGYGPVTITRPDWTVPSIVANKAVSAWKATPTLWTCTAAPQNIYGYAITDPNNGKVLLAERFAALVDLTTTPIIGVLPRITLTTE